MDRTSNVSCKTIKISATQMIAVWFWQFEWYEFNVYIISINATGNIELLYLFFLLEKTMANPTDAVDLLSDRRSWYRWISMVQNVKTKQIVQYENKWQC